ncbi:phage integrase central domain-containing protein [Sulfurimonas sp. NW15]|uniref:phage integrase central domain-containing protein n=1 Tax=Sulfurimonas sp. NW15 TaxID=2922729 RepID=UPI003DA9B4D9
MAKRKSKLTFDDLAEKYFADKTHTTKEANKEKARYINHIQKDIEHMLPENISSDQLLKMQTNFKKRFSPRTTNHLIFLIGTIFKYATQRKLLG